MDVPRYNITITIQGVAPMVWDQDDIDEVKADPRQHFNETLDVREWLDNATHGFSVDEVEEA